MELVSIAALSDNRIIGTGDDLPWHLPEDKKQYRERVADSPVILGRRTFEMMRDDLPGSAQIVLSRSEQSFEERSAYHADGVEEAISIAASLNADRASVLGGEAIYRLFQSHLDRMILSRVPGEYEGDAFYPTFDETAWRLVAETPYENFTLEEWVRIEAD